jgi:6-phosphogluconolactonase
MKKKYTWFLKKSISIFITFILISMSSQSQIYYLFIGTYTNSGSKGIYVYSFDIKSGKAVWVSNTDSATNPSYLTLSKNGNFLFSVNETHGDDPGRVSSYSFNKEDGKLSLLNSQLSGGDDPCFVATDANDHWLTVANYSSGSTAVFPIDKNGSLQPFSQLIETSGSSVNKKRQEKSHIHETVFSPDGKYLFTPDLGTDKIMIYKFDAQEKKPLKVSSPAYKSVKPGSGPRHITFHPNKKFAYVINELSGSVITYQYKNGELSELQNASTHPKDFKGVIGAAEIQISADGKFLYASNRGDQNSITIFSIDEVSGKLKLKGFQSTSGKGPRHFIIDPSGNYLLVANQGSDNVVIFKRDKKTGLLKETGEQIHIPTPVCVQLSKK